MREFKTGATRDVAEGKLDYHRFLCPFVLQRYCEYLQKHQKQADGKMREGDNWKKGIPIDVYMASLTRHFVEVWQGWQEGDISDEALSALLFNAMGMMHELLKEERDVEEAKREEGPWQVFTSTTFGPRY